MDELPGLYLWCSDGGMERHEPVLAIEDPVVGDGDGFLHWRPLLAVSGKCFVDELEQFNDIEWFSHIRCSSHANRAIGSLL